jgi:hypothetical protein
LAVLICSVIVGPQRTLDRLSFNTFCLEGTAAVTRRILMYGNQREGFSLSMFRRVSGYFLQQPFRALDMFTGNA